jgi:hypothetical protein
MVIAAPQRCGGTGVAMIIMAMETVTARAGGATSVKHHGR